jgi:hypothetical protein
LHPLREDQREIALLRFSDNLNIPSPSTGRRVRVEVFPHRHSVVFALEGLKRMNIEHPTSNIEF